MIDPKQAADMEAAYTFLAEVSPPHWRRLYENSLKEGFTETQAFSLLRVYILANFVKGVNLKDE